MTNTITSPRPAELDNHTNVVHDLSKSGDTSDLTISDINQIDGIDSLSSISDSSQYGHVNPFSQNIDVNSANLSTAMKKNHMNSIHDTLIEICATNVENSTETLKVHKNNVHERDYSKLELLSVIGQYDGADTESETSLNHSINNIPVVTSVARKSAPRLPPVTRV